MRRGNIQVSSVAFDHRLVHDKFANIAYRITAGGSDIKEEWVPGGLTNTGIDCSDDLETDLMKAFFRGFRRNLPEKFAQLGYKIEILSHWYHPVDSTNTAYLIAGQKAAEEVVSSPDIFATGPQR